MIQELDDASLEQMVKMSNVPVVVDFYANKYGSRRNLFGVLEELAGDYEGKIQVCALDVDASPGSASRIGVKRFPTVVLFDRGEVIGRLEGEGHREEIEGEILRPVAGRRVGRVVGRN